MRLKIYGYFYIKTIPKLPMKDIIIAIIGAVILTYNTNIEKI